MLTAEGFKRKRYEDFIGEMEADARVLFGEDVNLSDNSNLGKLIKLWAYARAEENELAEAIYYSGYHDTAEGISLDYKAKDIGITRKQAAKATGAIRLTVTPGITVAAGLIVATTDEIEFVTTASASDADQNGIIDVDIEAMVAGVAGIVPANTITVINTPVEGVEAATNLAATTGGQDKETDEQLRDRYKQSVSKGGASTVDGVRATILNDVAGVRACIVVENHESVADAGGRPPHSFEAVVLGGSANDIGAAILKAKPAGIRAYGSQTVAIEDDSRNIQNIGFSYANELPVYVNVDVTTNAAFPSNGNDIIKLNIIEYIGGVDNYEQYYIGLDMGFDVIIGQVTKAVFEVVGVVDAVVTLSTDNITFNAANVVVSPNQVAQTSWDKVVIV